MNKTYVASTYGVKFVVFVFGIDVFDICNNVGVQRLWRGQLRFRMATMERKLLNTENCHLWLSYFALD